MYTYLNISLQKPNVGTGSIYTHDVLSKRSVSMIYNVTNIKLIYLIFLKEILSLIYKLSILDSEVKHTLQVLNEIRVFATPNDVCALFAFLQTSTHKIVVFLQTSTHKIGV